MKCPKCIEGRETVILPVSESEAIAREIAYIEESIHDLTLEKNSKQYEIDGLKKRLAELESRKKVLG